MKFPRIKRGDHIKVLRGLYSHHGIYIDHNQVIHYDGDKKSKLFATVRKTTMSDFACGNEVEVVSHEYCHSADEVVDFAESRIGEKKYNLVFNNCEHFARECKTGERKSKQVENVGTYAGMGVAVALIGKRPHIAVGIVAISAFIFLVATLVDQPQEQPSLA